jgi:hypothetical protein
VTLGVVETFIGCHLNCTRLAKPNFVRSGSARLKRNAVSVVGRRFIWMDFKLLCVTSIDIEFPLQAVVGECIKTRILGMLESELEAHQTRAIKMAMNVLHLIATHRL